MAGMKRSAGSDSNPDANEYTVFQNKRVMAGSSFDFHRPEPSQQHFTENPPLDTHRAELSRQHVRALNTQFASWVQTQLQNHPDELWEDGVQDYLTHALNIMEKFSDIVNWLKANATREGSFGALGSNAAPKKLVSEMKDNQIKLFSEKSSFAQAATAASFTPSWSSGVGISSQSFGALGSNAVPQKIGSESKENQAKVFSEETSFPQAATTASFMPSGGSEVGISSQPSFQFGSQSSAPLTVETSNDMDGEEDLQQPSSPSVKKTEEKGIIVVHEVKCKLYVKSSDPADKDAWKDKGTGQLSIKCKEGVSKGTKESKPTILVRNDVGKLLLNALLYPGIKTNVQKNSIVAIFHTAGDDGNGGSDNSSIVARTFLIRTKTEEDRNKLAAAIKEYAPVA
ncbi:hypothetical protein NMG60_11027170 [Bertholletia excelsa]